MTVGYLGMLCKMQRSYGLEHRLWAWGRAHPYIVWKNRGKSLSFKESYGQYNKNVHSTGVKIYNVNVLLITSVCNTQIINHRIVPGSILRW